MIRKGDGPTSASEARAMDSNDNPHKTTGIIVVEGGPLLPQNATAYRLPHMGAKREISQLSLLLRCKGEQQ